MLFAEGNRCIVSTLFPELVGRNVVFVRLGDLQKIWDDVLDGPLLHGRVVFFTPGRKFFDGDGFYHVVGRFFELQSPADSRVVVAIAVEMQQQKLDGNGYEILFFISKALMRLDSRC
jgi:hypothetical protein